MYASDYDEVAAYLRGIVDKLNENHQDLHFRARLSSRLGEQDTVATIILIPVKINSAGRYGLLNCQSSCSVALPVFIDTPPPFPEGRMAHFMGLVLANKKRARPRDWIAILDRLFAHAEAEALLCKKKWWA